MTPKTQSVCKHCDLPIERCGNRWISSGMFRCWGNEMEHCHEPVSEPASTGEPPPKCTKCGGNLVALPTVHCPKCASTNFLTGPARPYEPSAPQPTHCQECHEVVTFNGSYNQFFHEDGTSTYPKCTRPKSAPECDCSAGKNARLYEHHRDCHWLQFVTRPENNPAAPQTSAELACQKCVEGIHGHCSGDCECRLSKCNLKVSAPQPVSGDAPIYMTCTECGMNVCDHIVKRLAGDAPQVEEIQRALVRWLEKWELIDNPDANVALRLAMDEIFDEKENADLLAILRPYFPPASQTPDFHTWLTRVHGFKVGTQRNSYKESDLEAAWNAGMSHRPEVIGAKPLCLDCHGAGIINCSHFDNCSGKWVYAATPASTARTDGWVSVEERLPKHCNPVEVMAIRFNGEVMRDYSFFCDGEWDGVEDQGYRIKPKIVYWHELLPLPAATGSVPQAPKRPTIVVLCGSTRFYSYFQEANYRETMAGKIVLSIGFYPRDGKHNESVGCTPEQKIALDELYFRKIELADEVLVLNVGGYMGESTTREVAYAAKLGKKINYLEAGVPQAEPKEEKP